MFAFMGDPNMFKKLVRGAEGVEKPTAEQVQWRDMKDRLERGTQINPQVFKYETPEWLKKELNRNENR